MHLYVQEGLSLSGHRIAHNLLPMQGQLVVSSSQGVCVALNMQGYKSNRVWSAPPRLHVQLGLHSWPLACCCWTTMCNSLGGYRDRSCAGLGALPTVAKTGTAQILPQAGQLHHHATELAQTRSQVAEGCHQLPCRATSTCVMLQPAEAEPLAAPHCHALSVGATVASTIFLSRSLARLSFSPSETHRAQPPQRAATTAQLLIRRT